MSKSADDLRQDIVDVGRLAYQKGWVAANDGNISVRLDGGRILCTSTGISKGMMTPGDVVLCDMDGNKLEGARERTSEIAMHVAVYRARPDIFSVLHAHPPTATGFAVAGRPLTRALLPETVIYLGCVPLAEYGQPGTPALTESIAPFLAKFDAILLSNHGVVTFGPDLYQAFFRMETVEHSARIALVAELLGGARTLPRDEVQKLFEARRKYGVSSRAGMEPGYPGVAEDEEQQPPGQRLKREELLALVEEALRARGVLF